LAVLAVTILVGLQACAALIGVVAGGADEAAAVTCDPAGEPGTATGLPESATPELVAEAVAAAGRHSIRSDVFLALITVESGWRVDAESYVGAIGLTQLMPATARSLEVADPWDPAQNLDGGARALAGRVSAKAGDYRAALAGYNGGTTPPASSWRYADHVLGLADTLEVVAPPVTVPVDCLPSTGPPTGPVGIEDTVLVQGRIRVHGSIAGQVDAMMSAAAADGITLAGGGYRTTAQQWRLRVAHCPDPVTSPATSCSPPTAKPGSSMHELGLAIDFVLSPGVYDWLVRRAGEFGFRNLPSERWHWSTTGR
jgi:hypothetical protein